MPITFTLADNAGNPGPAAATICFLEQAGKHSAGSNLVCYQLTAQVGAGPSVVTVVPPNGATRVVVEVDAPVGGGNMSLVVGQPIGANYQLDYSADFRAVWDIQ